MHSLIKSQIIGLAKEKSQQEICGFILYNNDKPFVFACKNMAENPADTFEISHDDHILAMQLGMVIGIYHSHPATSSAFSPWDIEHADELCIPYYVYSVLDNTWAEYIPPSYTCELEGMHFIWGFQDCYGLTRTYYRQTLKLYLGDYDRDDDFDKNNDDIIVKNFEKEDFQIVEDINSIQLHDAFLFKTARLMPQHLGIFVGDSKMLHHPVNSLSHIDAFSDRWISRIHYILRHKSQFKGCNS